jgi:ribonuclease R
MEPQDILSQMRRQPNGRISIKHLVKMMRVKGPDRNALHMALDHLAAEGKISQTRHGHFKLVNKEDSSLVSGVFSQHPSGFGFVAPDRPIRGAEGDIYIDGRSTMDAMHEDRVLVRIVRTDHERGRVQGEIRQIIERTHSEMVGKFVFGERGCHVETQDARFPGNIEIIRGSEMPPPDEYEERLGNATPPKFDKPQDLDGMMVTVALTEFPSRYTTARGKVSEVLGFADDFGVDVEVMIRKKHIPHRFPADTLEEAAAVSEEITAEEISQRRDFRKLPIVTIDGATARDFDDAILVTRQANGSYSLQVHIADVSHYVRPGSPLDREARRRGTSTYFPDRAVPMLPTKLSTGVCSLNPGVDRLVLSALLELNDQGDVTKADFCRGVICSAARMTYKKVFQVLEGDAEACREYSKFQEQFGLMRELAEVLMAKRRRRGSVDLDLPEAEIQFDDEGRMTGVKKAERNIAHRLIEEFMLAANEAVATRLEDASIPSLHRTHDTPRSKSVLEFEEIARSFGHTLGIETSNRTFHRSRKHRDGTKSRRDTQHQPAVIVSSKDYQKLADRIKGTPEERIISYRMLRSFTQARYSEMAKGHFALATDRYLHFTSPIRRYPDLIDHRILKALIDSESSASSKSGRVEPYTIEEIAQLADETSLAERRSAGAERELISWKKARFMEGHLGEEYDALIVSVSEKGMWVELDDFFVEGFVPADAFAGENIHFRERQQILFAASSKTKYRLGGRAHVRLDRIDWERFRPEFTCLGVPQDQMPDVLA